KQAKAGYYSQEFQHGTIYWSKQTSGSLVQGGIRNLYNKQGGPTSQIGLPIGVEKQAKAGYYSQEFQHGTIYWSKQTSGTLVEGAFHDWYIQNGGPEGPLGLPTGLAVQNGTGLRQTFTNGTLLWSKASGVTLETGSPDAPSLPQKRNSPLLEEQGTLSPLSSEPSPVESPEVESDIVEEGPEQAQTDEEPQAPHGE
ncbi:LGFP repeat-containing protein, partial [Leucobacter chinensis]|uniref:LGFP repeat-containing protein n=1 Tax=Leucobacter chinensis TaxID=2851010 RepID=UPI003510B8A1